MPLGALLAMGALSATSGIISGVNNQQQAERRNDQIESLQPRVQNVNQRMGDARSRSGQAIEQTEQRQEQAQSDYQARVDQIVGTTFQDFEQMRSNQGMMSVDEYIANQQQIAVDQLQSQKQYEIQQAQNEWKFNRERQELQNLQEQNKLKKLVASRGLTGSSIADQSAAAQMGEQQSKMIALARKYNTTVDGAIQAEIQGLSNLEIDLSNQKQDLTTQEVTAYLGWQASQRQSAFQDLSIKMQQYTADYQMQVADIQFEITAAQAEMQEIQSEMPRY